jgi:mitofusin
VLVDEFSLPFHPEQLVLNVYKKELHIHVENGLGSNLRARLSTALAMNMENSQREMTGDNFTFTFSLFPSLCGINVLNT